MAWLLKGGRVIDPATGVDERLDVLLEDGIVRMIGRNLPEARRVLDCEGKIVAPGLIDLGARVGEPGFEHRETIASATKAAAVGGFTALCALPEGDPVLDTPQAVRFVVEQAAREGVVRVYPTAALTKGAGGRELTETGALKEVGTVALAALRDVEDGGVLRRALQYAGMFDVPVMLTGVDAGLAGTGVMHEGIAATTRGVLGIPSAAEEVAVARAVAVAKLTGAAVHLLGVSSAGAVDLLRWAKDRHASVTASVSAQQLVFVDDDVRTDDTRWKVEPPFRSRDDVEALRVAVSDGVIDAVFSDHRPWSEEEKDVEFDHAPFGMAGLETALPLMLSELVRPGLLSLGRVIECMSAAPARILGVDGGTLREGASGDVTVIDVDQNWTFEATRSYSFGRNTPVDGRALTGRPVAVFVAGRLVMEDGRIIEQ